MRIGSSTRERLAIGSVAVLPVLVLTAAALYRHWVSAHHCIGLGLLFPLLLVLMQAESAGAPDAEQHGTANLPNLMLLAEELSSSVEELDARNRELQAQNEALIRQLCELQADYEQQRSISATLQESFLPHLSRTARGYDIAHRFIPARSDERIGGDFYDVFEMGNHALGLVIGDVSGKGVGATMHAAMAKYMLLAIASQESDPERVVTQLNRVITQSVYEDMFITLFFGVLYTEEGRLVYTNAGHEVPILLKGATGECISLETTGCPVGIFSSGSYERRETMLGEGDALLLCTDGITEARRGKDFFGPEGLQKCARDVRDRLAGEMLQDVLRRVEEFTGGGLGDDAALVVIKSPHNLTRI